MKWKKAIGCAMAAMMSACVFMTACAPTEKNKGKTETTDYGNEIYTAAVENPDQDVEIKFIRGRNVLGTGTGEYNYNGTLQAGDIIEISSDYAYIAVNLFDALGESIVYSPSGRFTFQVPPTGAQGIYPNGCFSGNAHTFTARVATDAEIASGEGRNLAVNPYDYMYVDEQNDQTKASLGGDLLNSAAETQGEVSVYPHAYANRVTRGEAQFYARNAIDGSLTSDGHGEYPYQSWGYDQKSDAEFVVYFGREVVLSEIAFVLRADFSGVKEHDTYWQNVTVEFSDGTSQTVSFEKSGSKQSFSLDNITTESVRIKNINAFRNSNSEGYAALTEFEAIGTETVETNPVAVKSSFISLFGGKEQKQFTTSDYTVDEIKSTMKRTNDWFINKTESENYQIPDSNGSMMTVKINDDDWKDAVYYSGLMEYFMSTGDMDSYYFLRSIGSEFDYLNNRGKHTPHGDHYQIGETYLMLNELSSGAYKTADTIANAEYNLERDDEVPSGDGVWYDPNRDWGHMGFWWCDALYMAMNTYTLLSRQTGDSRYVEAAYEGYQYWKGELYNETYDLWHRDGTQLNVYCNLRDENGNKVPTFWSRGNAWVLAALAKQLLYLDPEVYPDIYQTYEEDFLELAASILQYQRADGTWNASIVDESFYGGKETTGTCGFIYAYCVGLSLGILDPDTYYPAVQIAYDCVVQECILEDGQLGYMQTTGYQPQNYKSEDYSRENTHEFGMGLFLLACSGMIRICSDYEDPTFVVPADPQAALIG